VLYTIRTSNASAYCHHREVERLHGYPLGMHERGMRAIGNLAILGGIPNFLVFDRTGSQLVPILTLKTVR
jgi:hypothetical protein